MNQMQSNIKAILNLDTISPHQDSDLFRKISKLDKLGDSLKKLENKLQKIKEINKPTSRSQSHRK